MGSRKFMIKKTPKSENSHLLQNVEAKKEKNESTGKKKIKGERGNHVDDGNAVQTIIEVEAKKEKNESTGKKKRKGERGNRVDDGNAVQTIIEVSSADNLIKTAGEKKKNKSKKKRKHEVENNALIEKFGQPGAEDEKCDETENLVADPCQLQGEIENSEVAGKSKGTKKKKKNNHRSLKVDAELKEKMKEADQDEAYIISSGDEDCSKGMKKWITEYHQSRPGLKVLQQRIDEFITAHEAQLEEERKEREAQAAEGGWTVVVHHKGRKKTTDSESGTVVASVAQAVVEDKMANKKKKEVGLDFYRFQRREAKRNEIMMLQSKFEQDRKRIQQLRAARKFKPY